MNKSSLIVSTVLVGLLSISAVSVFSNPTSMEIFNSSANTAWCNDTDGGIRFYTPGTVRGSFLGLSFENKDYCAGNNTLNEYYCYSGKKHAQLYSCGLGGYAGYSYCKNNSIYRHFRASWCEEGACKYRIVDVLQEQCAYGCFNGICKNQRNFSSTNVRVATTVKTTSTSLLPQGNFSCYDSDNGIELSVKGFTTGYSNGLYYYKTDRCTSNVTITEWYCSSSVSLPRVMLTETKCPVGKQCLDGACI